MRCLYQKENFEYTSTYRQENAKCDQSRDRRGPAEARGEKDSSKS